MKEMQTSNENNTNLLNDGSASVASTEQLVFYFFSLFLGVAGNCLVLLVILSEQKRVKINDIYIVNLAVSDLIFLLVRLPVKIYESMTVLRESWFYCKVISPAFTITVSVSIFTLSCMAVHRCIVMLNPLRLIVRRRYAILSVVIVWILAVVVALPITIISSPNANGKCMERWPSFQYQQVYTVSLFVIQYILPLFIIAVAYIRISHDLMSSSQEHQSVHNDMENRHNYVCRRQENIQVIKTLTAIVILFAIFMLPNHVAWMALDFGNNTIIADNIFKFSDILMYLHACVNPVVYGTITRRFRRKYIKYFCYLVSWMPLLVRVCRVCHCRCKLSLTVKQNNSPSVNKEEEIVETRV